MDDQSSDYVQGVVEALLFVSERPISLEQFKEVLGDVDGKAVRQSVQKLKEIYEKEKRGMVIAEIAGGYQMLSNPDYVVSVRAFYRTQKKEKLSKPALESLAIVAYKQPVTRLDVELIRGVNSDGVVNHLLEKDLLKITGRKEVPGKPYLYGTTKQFLEYFGLHSLSDLPKLEEFASLEGQGEDKIHALQKISEEFKQRAVLDSDKGELNLGESVEDKKRQDDSVEEENSSQEQETNYVDAPVGAETTLNSEGGNDEHPQSS